MMMERAPHQLIEGMIISAFAIHSPKSYIYIRGEYVFAQKIVRKAIDEAYAAGLLGEKYYGLWFYPSYGRLLWSRCLHLW